MPLRRADRLFDIIRILSAASQPVTAAPIADELEGTVTDRLPGCRDIAGASHRDRGLSRRRVCAAAPGTSCRH